MNVRFAAVVVLCLAPSVTPAAAAGDTAAARTLCTQIEAAHPLPPALESRILIVQKSEPSPLLFYNADRVTAEEIEALAAFDRVLQPCREAMLTSLGATPLAEARRDLFSRNEKVLFDLMARRITFGEANRRWEEAQRDYLARAGALKAQVQPVRMADTQLMPSGPPQ